ncbi:MAG: LysE family transporter [Candidatus Limnocylindrales bacterium]
MLSAAVAGAVAGYAIAIPVGVIAILILSTAASRGLVVGLAAGAGAASADGAYALLAALFGTAVGTALAPWLMPLRVVAAVALAAIGAAGLWSVRREALATSAPTPGGAPQAGAGPAVSGVRRPGAGATYLRFLGLTLLNPVTVIYFAALMVGLPAIGSDLADRLAFVVGAFVASLSWQSLLAAVGAVLHRRTAGRGRLVLSTLGYLIVLAFAVRIGLDVLGA